MYEASLEYARNLRGCLWGGAKLSPPTTPAEIPAPSMRVAAPGTSTTTVAPNLYGGWQATTTRRGLDQNGNPVTQRDIYREGVAGSSESHETFTIDPRAGGTTFQSTTTANPP